MLKILNTLTKQKETFTALEEGIIKFYHCGPTVYWNQHIGNMRGMVLGDFIRRSLIYIGYDVRFVRNYTDFGHLTSDADEGEDKMEKAAKREQLDPQKIADKYILQFEADTAKLHVMPPTVTARATNYLQEMIKMVQELLDKGFAYSTPKAIYFDTAKFPAYNDLNGQILSENKAGAGFGTVGDQDKKNPADFALWFFKTGPHKNALQYWPSPFDSTEVENGEGFPGWHIECSSMIRKELGNTIDIHMGGIEHIAVHHTNEIAQSEAANGVKFVNYWLHNEHLTMNDKKISKSDGNFVLLDELIEKGYTAMDLRYLFLQSHYRSKQNFSEESLNAARNALTKLNNVVAKLKTATKAGEIAQDWQNLFQSALEDDFNTPKALAVLWDLLKSETSDTNKLATIMDFDKVFALDLGEVVASQNEEVNTSPEVEELVAARNLARSNKDFAKADAIRDRLIKEFGYQIKDK